MLHCRFLPCLGRLSQWPPQLHFIWSHSSSFSPSQATSGYFTTGGRPSTNRFVMAWTLICDAGRLTSNRTVKTIFHQQLPAR